MMNDIKILGKVIDLLRENGIDVTSPYDVENFFEDLGGHEAYFKTGRFPTGEDDEV